MDAGKCREFFSQDPAFLFRDKLARLNRVDQQLQLGKLKQTPGEIVSVLGRSDCFDLIAGGMERNNILLDRNTVGLQAPSFF